MFDPDKLKELRERAGFSTTELGERANLSQRTISGYELGQALPNVNTLAVLADALGAEIGDFCKKVG